MKLNSLFSYGLAATAGLFMTGIVTAAPVAYWGFDSDTNSTGGINDQSSNGNNGTAFNGIAFDTAVPSAVGTGNSALFSGYDGTVGQYILIDSPDYYGIGGADPRTFVAWIKTDATNQAGLIEFGDPGASLGKFVVRLQGGVVRAEFKDDFLNGTVLVNNSVWNHVAVVYDGTAVEIFVNGVSDGSKNVALDTDIDPNTGGKVLSLAGLRDNSTTFNTGKFFAGHMDDVALYDFAASSSDIAALYNGTLTPMQVVPEPAAMGLLGLSALVMLRRRRQLA